MTMNLNRRLFLRGVGGAAVAAPFLTSVAERAAKAQGEEFSTPKRLIVQFTHYGCMTDAWFPMNSHGALTAADYEGMSIESLAPYADKILMPRGIRAMNEWTAQQTTGQGNDPHTQVVGTYFTCVPVTPHTNNPFEFGAATKFNAMPTAPSLDHVCAKQVSPSGIPLFMRVSGNGDSAQSAISYSAGEEPFAGIGAPRDAFSTLTGLFGTGGDEPVMNEDTYQSMRGKSIMDLIKADLETLERFDMSMSDRDKLEAWKELLSETGNGMAAGVAAQCDQAQADALGLTDDAISGASMGLGGDISTKVTDTLDAADIYSNVAVLSALCDANRVIFLKYPGNYTLRGLGIEYENHNISHRIDGAGMGGACAPGANDSLLAIDRFYAEKFAHLVGQLDSFAEGDGTVLDNCAAVWFQEVSDGNAHNLNNMPIIHAGGCGGYFKTGQAVNVDDGTADLNRGNSIGPCEDDGSVTSTNTGTSAEFGNAPINKYYCNLMNAIGVKADDTGFPTEGGSAEVTHYGMYDDTTDFASGGSNPAKINSPGGFEELKANG